MRSREAAVASSTGRSPAQLRGERRVEAILEAAAALIAEHGLDALTMSAVAQRSGSAMGSLYHFFPDREALLGALTDRILAGVREMPHLVLTPDLARGSLAAFVHALIEPLAAFAIGHPELPELLGRALPRAKAIDAEIVTRLDAIVRARAPHMSAAERGRVARMTIGIVRAGLLLLAGASPGARTAVQTELEEALTGYLGRRLTRGATRSTP